MRSEHKRQVDAAAKLAALERAAFFEARAECHQLERLYRLASSRLQKIHQGEAERFQGESDLAWFALAEVSRQMPKTAAAFTLMAFAPLEQRVDFSIHPERREAMVEDVLEVGSISGHEVQL